MIFRGIEDIYYIRANSVFRTRSCLHSGEWSGEEPSCIHSVCPLLGNANNQGQGEGRDTF